MSAQAFIRSLKAASDPPVLGGPTKIQIAQNAWNDKSFYVPNKAEVIAQWILSKLLKEKAKEPLQNPILDRRFWTLLFDVISSQATPHSDSNTRLSKAWITPLLNRIPLAPILMSFFESLGDMESDMRNNLSQVVYSCLTILWPSAAHKLGMEALLECFGACLSIAKSCATDEGLAHIGIAVITSYRSSLWSFTNKKKIYLTFLENHFDKWLECVVLEASSDLYQTLLNSCYGAGIETLFNLDVLRQSRDSKLGHTLFSALDPTDTVSLVALPRLFESFIQAIKNYRGVLFGQGSNQLVGTVTDELHMFGMQFFVSCQPFLGDAKSSVQCWSTRVALLALVDQESLFDRKQPDSDMHMNQNKEYALDVLATSWDSKKSTVTSFAIESLSALARIDYNLILPALPRILPALLLANPNKQSSLAFLDLMLSYYTKTRTMNVYITALLSSLSRHHLSSIPGIRHVYQVSQSCSLLGATHLERLSKAIQGFLTSTQVLPVVETLIETLKRSWEQVYDAQGSSDPDHDEGHYTRGQNPELAFHSDHLGTEFSFSARVASAIFCSLPIQTVPENSRQKVWELVHEFQESFLRPKLTKTLKMIKKQKENGTWALQVVATAMLQLNYALNTSRHFTILQLADPKLYSRLSSSLKYDGLHSELHLEILRTFLNQAAPQDQGGAQNTIQLAISYLKEHIKTLNADSVVQSYQWTSKSHERGESALVLLHMVIERWLPIIESSASRQQLGELIKIIVSIQAEDHDDQLSTKGLQPHSLLMQTLHSAQFWELSSIRTVLLEFITDATSVFDGIDHSYDSRISDAISVYRLLLLFPLEYLSRPCRLDLMRRALAADFLIYRLSIDSKPNPEYSVRSLITLRIFLKRAFAHGGFIEQPIEDICDYLNHLADADGYYAHSNTDFNSATLDLVESIYSELFQMQTKSCTDIILALLPSFRQVKAEPSLSKNSTRFQCFVRMVGVLAAGYSITSFPPEIQSSMQGLLRQILSTLSPQLSALECANGSREHFIQENSVMILWRSVLSFGNWLGLEDEGLPMVGNSFVKKFIILSRPNRPPEGDGWTNVLVTTLAILLQEIHHAVDNDRASRLDFILATYIHFSRILGAGGSQGMDKDLSKACKMLPVTDFSHLIDTVGDALTAVDSSPEDALYLVQLSTVLLRSHPQNTLKHVQRFSTQCLNAFAGRTLFTEGPIQLRGQVFELIAQHCSDRPAILRLVDIGNIWTLMSKILSGSRVHDDETTVGFFHKIVTSINALVRFRRDLVRLTLPHLGVVLRQLLMSVRNVRPHLGSKQTALVTDSQPRWINVKHPLGAEEGKALARLLETLNTKSIVRNNVSSTEIQKAESLAKPFSKHASYVLKAYIDAMNDPFCILPSELRKELQRGLYALCDVVGDHSRDAMMSGLDIGGKATMKALWKEYEKQKYVGKG